MKTFNMTRPAVAALGLGMAEAALDFTRDELRKAGFDVDTTATGRARRTPPSRASTSSRRSTRPRSSRCCARRGSATSGKPNNLEASIAKAKAGAAVREITQGCIELLGPFGVSREHLLEKWFRDVRITDIYEGTGQIQRLIIARTILGYGREELR